MTLSSDEVRLSAAKAAATAALKDLTGSVPRVKRAFSGDADSISAARVISVVSRQSEREKPDECLQNTGRRTEVRGKRTAAPPNVQTVAVDESLINTQRIQGDRFSRKFSSDSGVGSLMSCGPIRQAESSDGSVMMTSVTSAHAHVVQALSSDARYAQLGGKWNGQRSRSYSSGQTSRRYDSGGGVATRAEGTVTRRFHVELNGWLLDCDQVSTLVVLVDTHLLDMDVVNLCTSALQLSKLAPPHSVPETTLARLEARGLELLLARGRPWPSQNLSNFSLAIAKLRRNSARPLDTALLEELASQAEYSIETFNPQNLANTAWAFATLGQPETALFNAIASRALETGLGGWNPQNVANLAWAFATADHQPPALLFDTIVDRALAIISNFNAQNVANIAWAFATLRKPSQPLFDAVTSRALALSNVLSPQNISNLLWAASRAREDGVDCFSIFSGLRKTVETTARRSKLPPQELSNIAYAYATSECHHPDVFAALSRLARDTVATFDSQHISNVAWAFATAGVEDTPLFDALQAVALDTVGGFTPQGIANLAWAFATSRHACPRLLLAMENYLLESCSADKSFLTKFTNQNLSNLVWAMSVLGHQAPQLYTAISETLRTRVALSAQHTATIVWAYAVAGLMPPTKLDKLRSNIVQLADEFGETGLCSLFNAELALTIHKPELAPCCVLPTPVRSLAERSWRSIVTKTRSSSTQDYVASLLRATGTPCQSEAITNDGLFSIDIAVVDSNGRHLAVEVDGPHHFTSNAPFHPLRKTLLRRQLLQARGWSVVSIPFFEWEALSGPAQQLSYLARKLCLPVARLIPTGSLIGRVPLSTSLPVA